ncbi:ABC transporter substrate-binding protein [Clostridium folliculivorans]|uniref:Extracellular solute-binding protein n=1 Tax=Clostridium folliculivorans TaxID=2886038 RepID=A0A9W5Y311_9CLOT|nr:ABC transporter substrate-binding protein [Clostridium folliculivorans]GKU25628.1 extracellular solute-binding protein [Clostridium folliculivorans]GKU28650.1 extracellular solute-binding protein [Clostridium folliculivorans]
MKKIKNIVFIVLIIILNCNLVFGCSKGKEEPKGKLSVLIQNNASQDVDVINTLIANYKKAHSQIEIKIENMTENEKIEKVTVDKPDYDVLICERNMMISMARQGYLSDISSNVSNNKMIDKFYSIVSTYGRIDDKYYGIGVMPYSLNFIYNRQQAAGYIKNSDEIDLMSLLRMSKEKNVKIPIVLPKEMDISLAVASIIADNMINEADLEKNFDIGQEKYKKLSQMQEVFKFMNTLYKDYGVSVDKFILSDSSIVKKVESGEVPFALVTTLSSKEIDESKNIAIVNNNIIDSSKVNPPVIIDHLVCQLQNAKNKDEVVRFLDYLSDDESYKALGKEGIITGNRSANSELKGLQSQMIWPISIANENNIVFYHNLPYKMKPHIVEQTKNLINGVYSGSEWQTIVDKTYTEKK